MTRRWRRWMPYCWVVLASGTAGGLVHTLITSDLPVFAKFVALLTAFTAWLGGIATVSLFTNPPEA